MEVIVYTLEFCPNCNLLKEFLREMDVKYEERDLSTAESRTDMIMCGCFQVEEAPVLRVDDTCYTSGHMFGQGRLDVTLVARALGGLQ